jgi:hypothetical protein
MAKNNGTKYGPGSGFKAFPASAPQAAAKPGSNLSTGYPAGRGGLGKSGGRGPKDSGR